MAIFWQIYTRNSAKTVEISGKKIQKTRQTRRKFAVKRGAKISRKRDIFRKYQKDMCIH